MSFNLFAPPKKVQGNCFLQLLSLNTIMVLGLRTLHFSFMTYEELY